MAIKTLDEAFQLMRGRLAPLNRTEIVPLGEADRKCLALDVVATVAHPRFDNSSVDGYAISGPVEVGSLLEVCGVSAAGGQAPPIPTGCCVRILTGAPIPSNTYAVVMQEDVDLLGGSAKVREVPSEGFGIRRIGEDVSVGQLLLRRGFELGPGSIGLLASQGLSEVEVASMPVVGVITTGDELVPAGSELSPSSIWDTTWPMLQARLRRMGVQEIHHRMCGDSREEVQRTIEEFSSRCDLVLVAGGASVGDRDYVPGIISDLGETVFHRVALRPGKPVLFGLVSGKPLFGLPGNPASSFVCFELFVAETVRRLAGFSFPEPLWIRARYQAAKPPESREELQRVRLTFAGEGYTAEPLALQESFGLISIAQATALARLPANRPVEQGEWVDVLPL